MQQLLDAPQQGHVFFSVQALALAGAQGGQLGKLRLPEAQHMQRLFYSQANVLAYKPAASLVSCRRGGASETFAQMNQFFGINNMFTVGSQYWNQIHGKLLRRP